MEEENSPRGEPALDMNDYLGPEDEQLSPGDEPLPLADDLASAAQKSIPNQENDDQLAGVSEYSDVLSPVAGEQLAGNDDQADDELAALGLGSDIEGEEDVANEEELAPGEQVDSGLEDEGAEDDAIPQPDEAEEDLPAVKKRTEEQEQREMQEDVRALVGQMEQAVDEDQSDVMQGRPGTRKLRMLQQVWSYCYKRNGNVAQTPKLLQLLLVDKPVIFQLAVAALSTRGVCCTFEI
jgi:hypothetical protein